MARITALLPAEPPPRYPTRYCPTNFHTRYSRILQRIEGFYTKFFNFLLKNIIYFSLIQSSVEHMSTFYGGALKTNIERLVKLQKKSIRLVWGAPWDAHTQPLFTKLSILRLEQLY